VFEQLIKREVNVFGDLTEQDRRDVSRLMKRYGGAATGSIAKLFMRATLADFREAESEKNGNDLGGLEDGNIAHRSSYGNVLNSNKLGLKSGFTVFKKHCDHVVEIVIDFIQGFSLGMSTGKTGNETYEQACLWAPFDYR